MAFTAAISLGTRWKKVEGSVCWTWGVSAWEMHLWVCCPYWRGQGKALWPISGSTRGKPICCPLWIQSVTCHSVCNKTTWKRVDEEGQQVMKNKCKADALNLFFKRLKRTVQVSLNSHCSLNHLTLSLPTSLHPILTTMWLSTSCTLPPPLFICHTKSQHQSSGPVFSESFTVTLPVHPAHFRFGSYSTNLNKWQHSAFQLS